MFNPFISEYSANTLSFAIVLLFLLILAINKKCKELLSWTIFFKKTKKYKQENYLMRHQHLPSYPTNTSISLIHNHIPNIISSQPLSIGK